jgi:hypothetical protein
LNLAFKIYQFYAIYNTICIGDLFLTQYKKQVKNSIEKSWFLDFVEGETMKAMTLLYKTLIFTVVIATFFILLFIFNPNVENTIKNPVVFKITYQFLLITVLGGFIAFLYREIENKRRQAEKTLDQEREEKLRFHENLKMAHSELLAAFNKAKTVRRLLRARLGTRHSINHSTEINAQEYEKHIMNLNDVQLTFEIYKKRSYDNSLYFDSENNLKIPLETIENYLNAIVKEFQSELTNFDSDTSTRKIIHLKLLIDFIGPTNAGQFIDSFSEPMKKTLTILNQAYDPTSTLKTLLVGGSRLASNKYSHQSQL